MGTFEMTGGFISISGLRLGDEAGRNFDLRKGFRSGIDAGGETGAVSLGEQVGFVDFSQAPLVQEAEARLLLKPGLHFRTQDKTSRPLHRHTPFSTADNWTDVQMGRHVPKMALQAPAC